MYLCAVQDVCKLTSTTDLNGQHITSERTALPHLLCGDVGLLFELLQGPHQQAEHTPVPEQEHKPAITHTTANFQMYDDEHGPL